MISYASVIKCGPGPAQKQLRPGSNAPLFETNAAAARLLRLSVLFGFEIRLQCFINPLKASQTLGKHPLHPPHQAPFPSSPALETSPSYDSLAQEHDGQTSALWHTTKLTLEKLGVGSVTNFKTLRTMLACTSPRPSLLHWSWIFLDILRS